ncbi:hypothetical protein RRG08_060051, partial [Elysia crispata]
SRTGQSDQQQSGLWQHDRDELFVSRTGQSDQQQSGLWQHDRDELFVSRAGQSDQQQLGLWQHDRDELFVSRTGHSDQQQSGLWQHDRDELFMSMPLATVWHAGPPSGGTGRSQDSVESTHHEIRRLASIFSASPIVLNGIENMGYRYFEKVTNVLRCYQG